MASVREIGKLPEPLQNQILQLIENFEKLKNDHVISIGKRVIIDRQLYYTVCWHESAIYSIVL